MSHDCGLPHLPVAVQKKSVPPGSHLYEQVLDDLRNKSSPAPSSSTSLLSSSAMPPLCSSQTELTCFRAQAGLWGENNSVGDAVNSWGYQARATREYGEGDWLRPCNACSGSGTGLMMEKWVETCHGVTWNEGELTEGYFDGGASSCGSCVRVCDFIEDLKIEDVQDISDEMGHSPNLLHHKRDYLAPGENPTRHLHPPREHSSPKRKQSFSEMNQSSLKGKSTPAPISHETADLNSSSHLRRSFSSPSSTSQDHVLSWSASSEDQGDFKFFISEEDPEDRGSPGAHPTLSRLRPRGSIATQRHRSPSPNRNSSGVTGNCRDSPQSSSLGGRGHKNGEKKGEMGDERRKRESGKSGLSPRRNLFPDVHQPRAKSSLGAGYRLSTSPSPMYQRRGSHEIPPGRSDTWGNSASSSSSSQSPQPTPSSTIPHGMQDSSETELGTENQFPEITDCFRMRSQSDVSIQVQRERELPRLPLLPQSQVEEVSHVHVHWADEERGSPLATSVLLSSIRPRAQSHGSADQPCKPILKKPLGFF